MSLATILLVDDDEMVQSVTRELLEVSGYAVLSATSGAGATALLQDPDRKIDLVLLDLSLPDVSGLDLLPELTALRPEVRIVVCTGSFIKAASGLNGHPAVKAILEKPFTLPTLKETVRNSLAVT
jgi:two-component system, cell cycle sensor histidine kinase and response regulator CckA